MDAGELYLTLLEWEVAKSKPAQQQQQQPVQGGVADGSECAGAAEDSEEATSIRVNLGRRTGVAWMGRGVPAECVHVQGTRRGLMRVLTTHMPHVTGLPCATRACSHTPTCRCPCPLPLAPRSPLPQRPGATPAGGPAVRQGAGGAAGGVRRVGPAHAGGNELPGGLSAGERVWMAVWACICLVGGYEHWFRVMAFRRGHELPGGKPASGGACTHKWSKGLGAGGRVIRNCT